jgi:hypothetical protein
LDSVYQCHRFCHQSPIYYPPLRPVCSRWLALTTYVAKPTGSRSSTSLLGKSSPYVSSLVTIAAPTRSTLQQVYFTDHPQSQCVLWLPFLPVLCCQ